MLDCEVLAGFPIPDSQPAPGGADPQVSSLVLLDGQDCVAAQARRVGGIMPVLDEDLVVFIEPEQSLAVCAYPDISPAVLDRRKNNCGLGQVSNGQPWLRRMENKPIPIVPDQPGDGAEPEKASPVL